MNTTLVDELGLRFRASFTTVRQFYAVLIAAPLALAAMHRLLPAPVPGMLPVLWSPLVEELLFRGVIQTQFQAHFQGLRERRGWSRCRWAGISAANAATSILFALAHLIHHTPPWAAATIVPSLVFGYFRERHHQVYPALILHAAYNTCYLAAAAG